MRTTRGLPFSASSACTVMREVLNYLFQSLFFSTNLPHNHKLYQGVAPPGLTYLTYRWRTKQGKEESKTQARQAFLHSCVCSNPPISPLIICNLSNLALYRLLALLQGSFTETGGKQCACCIRDEGKPACLYLFDCSHFEFFNPLILILPLSISGMPMFTYLCVSRHFRHYT